MNILIYQKTNFIFQGMVFLMILWEEALRFGERNIVV